jgi:hypothetical protein
VAGSCASELWCVDRKSLSRNASSLDGFGIYQQPDALKYNNEGKDMMRCLEQSGIFDENGKRGVFVKYLQRLTLSPAT